MVPMLAACAPSAAQIWRVKAATEVLPLVPVTAAIDFGLAREQLRRHQRERAPRVGDAREGHALGQRRRRHALGDHGRSTGRDRGRDEAQPVVLGARDRHECVTRLDRAAVGADAGHLAGGQAHIADGIDGEQVGEFHERSVIPGRGRRPASPESITMNRDD